MDARRLDPPKTRLDPKTLRCGEVEERLRSEGLWPVAGTDEVGRGPLAGPVVAAAVVLRDDAELPGLGDSKALRPAAREALVPQIQSAALAWAVAESDVAQIDELGILVASMRAMRQACEQVWQQLSGAGGVLPAVWAVDGHLPVPDFTRAPQRLVVKGDARSRAIAAASVLAKVERDRQMVAAAARFPGYGFERHVGYGTAAHLEALQRLGPCLLHRHSFAPVRAVAGARQASLW
jgi:ribonuclease HII